MQSLVWRTTASTALRVPGYQRALHLTPRLLEENDPPFVRPGPPPLPPKEQQEFERLVKENASM